MLLNNDNITLLDPTSSPRKLVTPLATRTNDIRGKRIGFLWNNKPNGDILFQYLEDLLRTKYEISEVVYKQKPTASIPAKPEILDELTEECDIAIVGLAD